MDEMECDFFSDLSDNEDENEIMDVAVIYGSVLVYNSIRFRHYLTRQAIVHPKCSAWAHLFRFGDDNSFLELTGFSRIAFGALESDLFSVEDKRKELNRVGRPALLDFAGRLGLFLFWISSTISVRETFMLLIWRLPFNC